MRACRSHLSVRWRPTADGASGRLFGALLKLLLQRGELRERRVRIRLVAALRAVAERLGVILLALGAIDLRAAVAAARTIFAAFPSLAFDAALIALLALLPLAACGARLLLVALCLRAARI